MLAGRELVKSNKREASEEEIDDREAKRPRLSDSISSEFLALFSEDKLNQMSTDIRNFLYKHHEEKFKYKYLNFHDLNISLSDYPDSKLLQEIDLRVFLYLLSHHTALFLAEHPNINMLCINGCSADLFGVDAGEEILQNLLSACQNMQGLDLDFSYNPVSNNIVKIISGMQNITRLKLNECSIGDESVKCLLSNPHLQYLDLSWNNFADAGIAAIAEAIERGLHAELELVLRGTYLLNPEPIVEAMKKNTRVIVREMDDARINLMNRRNELLKDYPEYSACIKRAAHEYGLYEYQANESPQYLVSLFAEMRKQETERMQEFRFALDDFNAQLRASCEESIAERERRCEM